jgi:dienelactone hydrolase
MTAQTARIIRIVAKSILLVVATAMVLAAAFSTRAHAAIVTKTVVYHLAGKDFEGFVTYDDSIKGTRPGILIAHDWMGITDNTRGHAEDIAKLGYIAFAADIYGTGIRPKNAEEAGQLAGFYKKDRLILRARMQQALKALREQPGVDGKRIAAIGYCFGGTAVLELARTGADLKDVVTFHGGLDSPKPEDGKRIKAKILALHGADDPFVGPADVAAFEDELRKANVDWQLVQYGGAVHSFTDKKAGSDNSKGAAYNEKADKRSFQAMQDFFKINL